MTVLNLQNQGWVTGKYPLFLGDDLGLHDTMNRPYPELFTLFKKLKSLDWAEDEIDLAQARMDFQECDKSSYDVMIKTLAWQYEADSVASRSIFSLFSPFISNSDLGQMMLRWSDNEALHATTYSEIVRQCINDPNEIFREINSNINITNRSKKIVETFNRLKTLGAVYTLNKDAISEDGIRKTILKALVCLYCLEGMEFMSSFACTFALAERELFLPVASLVQKIMIDETVHTKMDEAILKVLFKDPAWAKTFEEIKEDVLEILNSILFQELDWGKYIFSEGRSLVGLNEELLNSFCKFKAYPIYEFLGLPAPFTKIKENPLPWMDEWLDIDSQQTAAQETDTNNYRLNSVIRDTFDFRDFDFGNRDTTKIDHNKDFIVYSKDHCPLCETLKKRLKAEGYLYDEINISYHEEARGFLIDSGFRSLPQVFSSSSGKHLGDAKTFASNFLS